MDEHVEAVQRMQDYIEAHLDENIIAKPKSFLSTLFAKT